MSINYRNLIKNISKRNRTLAALLTAGEVCHASEDKLVIGWKRQSQVRRFINMKKGPEIIADSSNGRFKYVTPVITEQYMNSELEKLAKELGGELRNKKE